jgi:hypothetical protein
MAGTASVDTMLADAISKMDALTKRMDALETGEGHKNPIKGDDDKKKDDAVKAKSDDDDDDDDKKDDATTVKSKILADDDDDKKDDSKKADAKKADDGELEIKHKGKDDSKKADTKKADAKKADAKKADAKKADDDDDDDKKSDDDDDDKKSDDDDDDKKKDDDAKKSDSIGVLRRQIADQASVIARLERMMKPKSDDEHAAFADAQARADSVYQGFGKHAPRPLEGEVLFDYRKRLATNLKMHSAMWKGVKLSRLDEEAFGPIESQIYADAATAAANPSDLEAGELRMVTKIDPTTGVRSNVFYGKEHFVKSMGRPGRRVASFSTRGSV